MLILEKFEERRKRGRPPMSWLEEEILSGEYQRRGGVSKNLSKISLVNISEELAGIYLGMYRNCFVALPLSVR
ncbi:hypothetical protein LAZ67_9002684 [Cordylochernes scorpioides]|uniref:Uncharacterized protein n=1 Tax=Cordylochernes scorpioides TaxID=51811 RepID=A0ABY6KU11_9ARAC|nr:hypothetical protein LAZ67_9002684 [Cordylochernes scorpioides]